ncbi:fibroblast growth factor receptor-like 1 [Lates japonicus]|uniref:Fibroblast growth factor receptor-like 1 n=1 Tax=Lates japonicus TaxID=270547 RepID=A0AAD3NLG5_LATJO|nr:fibroblast growth factor receptor-like 1 [Lates japonicus]
MANGDSEHAPELAGKLVRPRFTQPAKMRKRVIARPVGSSVRLKCTASGNPRPDIVWLKDSRPLLDEDSGAGGGGGGDGKKKRWTLSLKNLTPEHSGKYTCHVSNRAGEINATYKVEVIPPPVNSEPHLQCKVHDGVKPVIQWPKSRDLVMRTLALHHRVGDRKPWSCQLERFGPRPDGSYLQQAADNQSQEEDAVYICLGPMHYGLQASGVPYLTVLPDRLDQLCSHNNIPSLPTMIIIGILGLQPASAAAPGSRHGDCGSKVYPNLRIFHTHRIHVGGKVLRSTFTTSVSSEAGGKL